MLRNGQVEIKIIITISVISSARASRMMKIADNSGQLDVVRLDGFVWVAG